MPTKTTAPRSPKIARQSIAEAIGFLEALTNTTRPEPEQRQRIETLFSAHAASEAGDGTGFTVTPGIPMHGAGIERQHRQAVRNYIESWVLPELRATLAYLDGGDQFDTFGVIGRWPQ